MLRASYHPRAPAPPADPPRAPWTLTTWYAAATGALALGPWLAVLLTDVGWSKAEASALLVALPVGRLLGVPLWAWFADRVGPQAVLRSTVLAAVASCVLLLLADGPWLVFVGIVAWALTRAPAFPIVDATTVSIVGRRYGRVRAVGSLVFLLAAAANGLLRDRWAEAPVLLSTGLAVAAAVVTWWLPPLAAVPSPPTLASVRGLLRHRVLVPVAIVAVLHGVSLSAYDTLLALHVEALGLPSTVTGAAIATAVACEVVVLALGDRLLAWLGPVPLFVLGVAGAVPRYLCMAFTEDPALLVLVQALHGLNFGAFWIAATALFAEHAPPDLRYSTQALLPAAAFGAGPLLGLAAGAVVLTHETPATLFLGMAGVSAVTAAIAFAPARRRAD